MLLSPEEFPEGLAEVDLAPPALAVWGDPAVLHQPCVGIVGTRRASTYGKAVAQKFAEALARAGVTVVSGGALGIDAAAHRGALAGGGATVAVLATGADGVYPPAHGGLFTEIRQGGGALVSSYAFGSKLADYKFLQRNSLIAAFSQAVLVVEAPERSGALRTALVAAEIGRDVYVVPAGIDQRSFFGSFNLLRDGATLAIHPDDLLDALGLEPSAPVVQAPTGGPGEAILAALTTDAVTPEILVERTGMAPSDLMAELTMLEIEGRVVRDGGRYALAP